MRLESYSDSHQSRYDYTHTWLGTEYHIIFEFSQINGEFRRLYMELRCIMDGGFEEAMLEICQEAKAPEDKIAFKHRCTDALHKHINDIDIRWRNMGL